MWNRCYYITSIKCHCFLKDRTHDLSGPLFEKQSPFCAQETYFFFFFACAVHTLGMKWTLKSEVRSQAPHPHVSTWVATCTVSRLQMELIIRVPPRPTKPASSFYSLFLVLDDGPTSHSLNQARNLEVIFDPFFSFLHLAHPSTR